MESNTRGKRRAAHETWNGRKRGKFKINMKVSVKCHCIGSTIWCRFEWMDRWMGRKAT